MPGCSWPPPRGGYEGPLWGLVRCLAQAGIEAWAELSPRADYAGHKTRRHPRL